MGGAERIALTIARPEAASVSPSPAPGQRGVAYGDVVVGQPAPSQVSGARLDSLQRTLVGRALLVLRRHYENTEQFFKRRSD